MVFLANAAVLVEHAGEDLLEEVKVLSARTEEPGRYTFVHVLERSELVQIGVHGVVNGPREVDNEPIGSTAELYIPPSIWIRVAHVERTYTRRPGAAHPGSFGAKSGAQASRSVRFEGDRRLVPKG